MKSNSDILEQLRALRLYYLSENYDDFVKNMSGKNPEDLIHRLLVLEQTERSQRSTQRRLTAAKIGRFKKMVDFDWSWPKFIDRPAVERLMELDFLNHQDNAILIGAEGLGKTMIAQNLAWRAVMSGRTARFCSASGLVTDLNAAGHLLNRRLQQYVSPDLLVIDELGYLAFEAKAADLLFEVITRRHEKRSTVLTTNLGFANWSTIFPGAACVTAMIDRLIHHCSILQIEGESFRRHESKKSKGAK